MSLNGLSDVFKNIDTYVSGTKRKMESAMQENAVKMENQAKQSAPWTDRTGNARNSISGVSVPEGNVITIYHLIGMEYGVFLELAHGGAYRVIWPTVDYISGNFFDAFKGI